MFAVAVFTLATLGSPVVTNFTAEREAFIQEINSKEGILWKADHVDRFANTPIGSSKSLCGVTAPPADMEIPYRPSDQATPGWSEDKALPSDFDSATAWSGCAILINDIRDQSNCGCCWAFGTAEAASDRMCIATNGSIKLPLSAESLCFCSNPNGCGGGFPLSAWNYIGQNGLVTGGQINNGPFDSLGLCSDFSLPHCHHHGPVGKDPYPSEGSAGCPSQQSPQCPTQCDSKAKAPHNVYNSDKYSFTGGASMLPNNAEKIQQEIMLRGPVTAAFSVYSDFEQYAGGIYHHVSGDMLGGHAVKITGWGEEGGVKYWKVANSWNPYWGEKGFFRIVRGTNECNIEAEIAVSNADAKWVPPSHTVEEM